MSMFFIAILTASALTRCSALLGGSVRGYQASDVAQHAQDKSSGMDAKKAADIPGWKLDLVAGKEESWWDRYGMKTIHAFTSSMWGENMPAITGSPGQDKQKCPILKLPDRIMMAAKHTSWLSLNGAWQTPEAVTVAMWDQNYIGMGFARDIKSVSVNIRAPSSGHLAARTRYFTNKEMKRLFDWKEPSNSSGDRHFFAKFVENATALKDNTFEDTEEEWNIAIFDCEGTLLYVVKFELPRYLKIYSRDGRLLTEALVGDPVLKYSFIDPKSGYLIADAETPGVGANMKPEQIPESYKVHHVLPFGFVFQHGGYANSSMFLEPEYRWVIAAAIQALTIFDAPQDTAVDLPWFSLTFVETFHIIFITFAFASLVAVVVTTYRCVYPQADAQLKDLYGRLSENPFLAANNCPPHKMEHADAAKERARLNGENYQGYGSNNGSSHVGTCVGTVPTRVANDGRKHIATW